MSKELIKVEIGEVVVEVQPNVEHEWLLSSKDVAEGYGLSESGLRMTKSRYSDELIEGSHFVQQIVTGSGGGRTQTMWTKEGVVMLGFFIKTPSAKEFRRWASNYIVSKQDEEKAIAIPQNFSEALKLAYEQSIQIEQMKPKVELYDDLTHQEVNTYNDMTIGAVGKELGYRPIAEFFPMLRKAGVIFMGSTEPKAEYIQKGWFRGTPINKGSYAGMSWKVTPEGMAGMLKKFGRKCNKEVA
jgi:phage antirepressor YoqD-like protein